MSSRIQAESFTIMHAATGENTNGSGRVEVNPNFMNRDGQQLYQQDWYENGFVNSDYIQTAMASKFPVGGPRYMFLEVESLYGQVYADELGHADVGNLVSDAAAVIRAIRPDIKILLTGHEHPNYFYGMVRGGDQRLIRDWNDNINETALTSVDGVAPYWYPVYPAGQEVTADDVRRVLEGNMEEALRTVGGSWQYPGKLIVPLIWWQYRSGRNALGMLSDGDIHRLIHAMWTYKLPRVGVWMHFATTDYTPPGLTVSQATRAYSDFYLHRLPRLIEEARRQRSSLRYTSSGPSDSRGADY